MDDKGFPIRDLTAKDFEHTVKRVHQTLNFRLQSHQDAKDSQIHPAIKLTPLTGGMAPSECIFVTASRYNEPEKITIPEKKHHQGPPFSGWRCANTNNITEIGRA